MIIQFIRNRAPHYAGERIGTDPVMGAKLIAAGYAVAFDMEAEARRGLPAAERGETVEVVIVTPPAAKPAKTAAA